MPELSFAYQIKKRKNTSTHIQTHTPTHITYKYLYDFSAFLNTHSREYALLYACVLETLSKWRRQFRKKKPSQNEKEERSFFYLKGNCRGDEVSPEGVQLVQNIAGKTPQDSLCIRRWHRLHISSMPWTEKMSISLRWWGRLAQLTY